MTIVIMAVGKFKNEFLEVVFRDYLDRAGRYFDMKHVELKKPLYRKKDQVGRVLKKERERLKQKMKDWGFTVILDEQGRHFTSMDFASRISVLQQRGVTRVTFFVGGAHGIDEQLKDSADLTISLSALTLPHELARVLLIEQIYRCGTIMAGESYHKE